MHKVYEFLEESNVVLCCGGYGQKLGDDWALMDELPVNLHIN